MSAAPSASWQEIAERVLADVLLPDVQADRALKQALRAHRHLNDEQRGLVADVALGACCLQGRLRHQLQQAGLPSDARHLASLYLLDERGLALAPVVERAALVHTAFPEAPLERLATTRSLPLWLAKRLLEERGFDDADALGAALNRRGPVCARVNTLKTTRSELAQALADEGIASRAGQLSPWALQLDGRPNIRGSRAWRAGRFEVQDEGSQLLALATRAEPGDVVVDLCAGRGGKSLALAALLENDGRVLAYDVDERRLDDLLPRRARAGASCVEVVREASALPLGGADVVLVDAPCSETGALRRGPHKRWLLDEREVARMPALQLDILRHASTLVKPGGRLVYATCSVLSDENERVVSRFLDENPRFAKLAEERYLPHVHGTDGFYLAALAG